LHVRGIMGASPYWHNYEVRQDGIRVKV